MGCQHEPCTCRDVGPDGFCSEYCRDCGDVSGQAADEAPCGCGHDDCAGTQMAAAG